MKHWEITLEFESSDELCSRVRYTTLARKEAYNGNLMLAVADHSRRITRLMIANEEASECARPHFILFDARVVEVA